MIRSTGSPECGVCMRENCSRKRAKNPRTGEYHNFCSLPCSRLHNQRREENTYCKKFYRKNPDALKFAVIILKWAASSEFVSSSIPSWQILTAHAQPFRGAKDLAFCLKVPLDSLLVWESSGGSGKTVRMRRLAWTVAARIGDKYQIRLTRPNLNNVVLP